MKRTALKKKSKTPLAKTKEKLWELCKKITRAHYVKKDGTYECFTCGRLIDSAPKAQTGHFIPSSTCGAYLRYNLRNLRVQDYYCNINLGGNGSEFYRKLVEEVGQEEVDKLFIDKNKVVKADVAFYEHIIEEYEKIWQKLK